MSYRLYNIIFRDPPDLHLDQGFIVTRPATPTNPQTMIVFELVIYFHCDFFNPQITTVTPTDGQDNVQVFGGPCLLRAFPGK